MKQLRLTMTGMLLIAAVAARAAWADSLLTGTITSAGGEKMGGVAVSARAERATITTTVFTDDSGSYYFPPLPNGNYRVWAQAIKYQTASANLEAKKKLTRRDFVLQAVKNQEDWVRQLPGD